MSDIAILKDCPCCGHKAVYDNSALDPPKDKTKWVVNCTNCTLSTSVPMHCKEFAAETWNRRSNQH